ncbi:hypothetical protein [Methanobacterium formicicum]|uniref:Uncharacterized protein n=1 Tax=Methanobacterium formicicum (strain DSM 3637 / PP1) TaxID=1204725 RepID=K2QWY6_METFP|nr:hypothetical protein [Methanobacterium formicicum]EKF84778.1 hypothetical protein A994_12231 [Methanobacterium formicicum DSM 3637]
MKPNKCFYKNIGLILIDKQKKRLLKTKNDSIIRLFFDDKGFISTFRIDCKFRLKPLNSSLEQIGKKYLELDDPSFKNFLNYLITPEMEIERIFNNIRYKYLECIYHSGLESPQKFINADYNNAFQSLTGIKVYQGSTKNRKHNDDYWREAGFQKPSDMGITFDPERKDLQFILDYIRNFHQDDFNRIYRELIAIKPGFHELLLHEDFYDSIPADDKARSQILRQLRLKNNPDSGNDKKMSRLPRDINSQSYLTYASCNITEGPFVFRKCIKTSYYNEIRKINSRHELNKLNESFNILDYCDGSIRSLDDLKRILDDAERFKGFNHLRYIKCPKK